MQGYRHLQVELVVSLVFDLDRVRRSDPLLSRIWEFGAVGIGTIAAFMLVQRRVGHRWD